ncbi:hypothetical protein L7F22_018872 [Adiantum nelumboides]|nr:hypothetical protein [Adiantum nelumboides]
MWKMKLPRPQVKMKASVLLLRVLRCFLNPGPWLIVFTNVSKRRKCLSSILCGFHCFSNENETVASWLSSCNDALAHRNVVLAGGYLQQCRNLQIPIVTSREFSLSEFIDFPDCANAQVQIETLAHDNDVFASGGQQSDAYSGAHGIQYGALFSVGQPFTFYGAYADVISKNDAHIGMSLLAYKLVFQPT